MGNRVPPRPGTRRRELARVRAFSRDALGPPPGPPCPRRRNPRRHQEAAGPRRRSLLRRAFRMERVCLARPRSAAPARRNRRLGRLWRPRHVRRHPGKGPRHRRRRPRETALPHLKRSSRRQARLLRFPRDVLSISVRRKTRHFLDKLQPMFHVCSYQQEGRRLVPDGIEPASLIARCDRSPPRREVQGRAGARARRRRNRKPPQAFGKAQFGSRSSGAGGGVADRGRTPRPRGLLGGRTGPAAVETEPKDMANP